MTQPQQNQTVVPYVASDRDAAGELANAIKELWSRNKLGRKVVEEDLRRLMIMADMSFKHQRELQRQIIHGEFHHCD